MKKALVLIFALSAVAAITMVPRIVRRNAIQATIESFRMDEAVWSVRQENPRDRTRSAAEFLNPHYLKKYGLDADAYLDHAGYFSPNGTHWKKWNIATRTAAICMWRDRERKYSAADVDALIRKIDAYYSNHSDGEAVVTVLTAVERQG